MPKPPSQTTFPSTLTCSTAYSPVVVTTHRDASSFLVAFKDELHQRPVEANLILPIAAGAAHMEEQLTESSCPRPRHPSVWVSISTTLANNGRTKLDFVAALTSTPVGDYPLFFFPAHHNSVYTAEFTRPRMARLIDELSRLVPSTRVFSVFALKPLAEEFARQWSAKTGHAHTIEPYFDAVLTTLTPETFDDTLVDAQARQHSRLATMGDLHEVAALFDGFARSIGMYPSTPQQALCQARMAIQLRSVWLYELESAGIRNPIGVVAALRNTPRHAFITKVFVEEVHRRNGLGKRLVAWVCEELFDRDYEDISLYVSEQDNQEAAALYDKVGFTGLCGRPRPPHVEEWIEFTFEGTIKGHW